MKLARTLLGATLALCACSCASLPSWIPGSHAAPKTLNAKDVPAAIERAQQDLAQGRSESALDWMRAASAAEDLPTEQRDQVQRVLEEAAGHRIDDLNAPGKDPADLADLVDLGLPRQLSVRAGLLAAQHMHADGSEMDAFRLLRKLDQKFPLHHERLAAGDLIVEVGMSLSTKHKHFLFFYSTDDQAEEVLEYAILQHPWAHRGDEATVRLSELYEQHGELVLAVDRLQKLILDHPNSPLRPISQARIPKLRLQLLKSPEYDRGKLLLAEDELKRWLKAYPDHELAPEVAIDLGDCLRRLCVNDLVISHFYRTVKDNFSAHYHARRAVEEATDAGDATLAAQAREALASLPPLDTSKPLPKEAGP